jgi:hypothetical protein
MRFNVSDLFLNLGAASPTQRALPYVLLNQKNNAMWLA